MDSYYIEGSDGDSRQSRTRSDSHLSTTASQFQDLNIKPPEATSSNQEAGRSKEGPTTTDTSLLTTPDPHPTSSSNFISSPTPQHITTFPQFSQTDLDANWSYLNSPEEATGPPPILRLPVEEQAPSGQPLGTEVSISRSSSFPANMSAVGIQNYDSRFDAGVQQSYTWPRFDLGDQFLTQQMSPPMAPAQLPAYEDKLMPMYARSISDSPPRANLTPEQRELKRQRDFARRDSKVRMRRDRSTSNPYTLSPKPSPEMLSRSLSEFSNTLAPSPLLSQGSQGSPNLSNISSPAYLSGYTPNLSDAGSNDMYGGAVFPPMPTDFNALSGYGLPYGGQMDPTLQSFVGRPHSLSSASDPSSMMQNMQNMQAMYPSPKMGSSDSADHVRVVHSRPKPQCWEHGCNGRQFSTFSNLLRHQREKSGAATKSVCPNCGAEFTRTTARNGHMAHEKCKQRRSS